MVQAIIILRNIDCEIPLGLFVAVAGVSGSGKSSLIDGILKKGPNQSPDEGQQRKTR
ncbi:MAG: hypothetical protein Ct9H300mP28_24730 [Pseudomonadota bacterium]|nr:MAG: hypothetical protein Ct9H300mP28_24730 [Pseudomonadota bacterium]